MRVEIPRSIYPLTRIVVVTPAGTFNGEVDQSHQSYDFELPEGVDEANVGIVAEFLAADRSVQSTAMLKEPAPPAPPAPPVVITPKLLQTRRPPQPKQDAPAPKQEEPDAPKQKDQQEAAGANADTNSVTPEPPNATP